MTYNYRIWGFFMIMYQMKKKKKLSWLICIKPPNIMQSCFLHPEVSAELELIFKS